jgi:large subunit ribosomal protein L24
MGAVTKSRTKMKIRKGDKVVVLTGRDKGIQGEVLRVFTENRRVLVQGVNVVKRHKKPSQLGAGGIEKVERPIHVSNVALVDPKADKPTRVGFKDLKDGKKVRVAKRSGETIE